MAFSEPSNHIKNNLETERARLVAERSELIQERAQLAARGDTFAQMRQDPNYGAARLSYIFNNDRSGLDAIAGNIRAAQMQEKAAAAQQRMAEAMAERAERSTIESNVSAYSDKVADQKNAVEIAALDLSDAVANYPEGSVERKKAQTAFDYQLKKYRNLLAKLNDYETRAGLTKTISDFDEPETTAPVASTGNIGETPAPTLEQKDNAFVANVGELNDSELVPETIGENDDLQTQASKAKRNAAIQAEKDKRKAKAKADEQKAAGAALKAAQGTFDAWVRTKTPNQLKIMSKTKKLAAAGIDATKYELDDNGKLKAKGK